jgi:hypothetical protein
MAVLIIVARMNKITLLFIIKLKLFTLTFVSFILQIYHFNGLNIANMRRFCCYGIAINIF